MPTLNSRLREPQGDYTIVLRKSLYHGLFLAVDIMHMEVFILLFFYEENFHTRLEFTKVVQENVGKFNTRLALK